MYEAACSINQKPARIQDVVSEVRPHIDDKGAERDSTKL
jgi:hypothetical protein